MSTYSHTISLVLQNLNNLSLCIFDLQPGNNTHSIELIPLPKNSRNEATLIIDT